LGARPIAEIEAPELVAMANAIQDRGARDIAKRALETVGQVFGYGRNPDIREDAISSLCPISEQSGIRLPAGTGRGRGSLPV
jgi:hypothetical protein